MTGRCRRAAAAALLLAAALHAASRPAFADSLEDLPEGPGREAVFYTCTACHGLKIVTQQGQSAERWDGTIDFMIERHGMAVPPDDVRREIVDYLATHFPARRGGYSNPFLKR